MLELDNFRSLPQNQKKKKESEILVKNWHGPCIYYTEDGFRGDKMNKFITVALFLSIFTGLYAMPEAQKVEEELIKFTPENEIQLANKLSALGSLKQKVRDYNSAIELYNKSLTVREKMGERESSGYALVLYLKSISEFRQGKSCQALENIKNVISIYQKIGDIDAALNAEEEAYKKYQEACSIHMENVANAQ